MCRHAGISRHVCFFIVCTRYKNYLQFLSEQVIAIYVILSLTACSKYRETVTVYNDFQLFTSYSSNYLLLLPNIQFLCTFVPRKLPTVFVQSPRPVSHCCVVNTSLSQCSGHWRLPGITTSPSDRRVKSRVDHFTHRCRWPYIATPWSPTSEFDTLVESKWFMFVRLSLCPLQSISSVLPTVCLSVYLNLRLSSFLKHET